MPNKTNIVKRNGAGRGLDTLNQRAWAAGFRGVAGLAKHVGRHRVTLHNAVRYPERYGPTVAAIEEALNG